MSDFFGDDFTAELRGYFIDTLSKENEKFLDLVASDTWAKLVIELNEQCTSWIVDARTNEFEHLGQWLEEFHQKSQQFQSEADLENGLKLLKSYLEVLAIDKKDAPEYLQRFSIEAKVVGQSQFLHCRIHGASFGISVGWVMEVIEEVPVHPLPSIHDGISGVISFRGEAIPVMNFKDYGFQTSTESARTYFVICNIDGARLALQVNEADQLLTLDNAQMQSAEAAQLIMTAPFIKKFFTLENQNVMVLDLETMVA